MSVLTRGSDSDNNLTPNICFWIRMRMTIMIPVMVRRSGILLLMCSWLHIIVVENFIHNFIGKNLIFNQSHTSMRKACDLFYVCIMDNL